MQSSAIVRDAASRLKSGFACAPSAPSIAQDNPPGFVQANADAIGWVRRLCRSSAQLALNCSRPGLSSVRPYYGMSRSVSPLLAPTSQRKPACRSHVQQSNSVPIGSAASPVTPRYVLLESVPVSSAPHSIPILILHSPPHLRTCPSCALLQHTAN